MEKGGTNNYCTIFQQEAFKRQLKHASTQIDKWYILEKRHCTYVIFIHVNIPCIFCVCLTVLF